MAVKYHDPGLIIFGAVLCAAVLAAAFFLRKKQLRRVGIKAANTKRFRALPAYRRKKIESLVYRGLLAGALALSLVSSLFLAARPYQRDTVREDVKRRDIFLCMDLSSSASAGISDFVEEFKKLVPELDGDQIGISLFNTSSIQFVPVTDDYRFVLQRLDELEGYFRAEEEFKEKYTDRYQYVYEIPQEEMTRYEELNEILSAFDKGVTAGYELKGTSVVGEGLVSCLFSFPDLYTEKRPRSILFVSDNLPEYIGTPLATLEEAASMCAADDVTVYGIYPASGTSDEMSGSSPESVFDGFDSIELAKQRMSSAVELTGGEFFDLGSSMSIEEILQKIRSQELTESKTAVATTDQDMPQWWTRMLIIGLALTGALVLYLLVRAGRSILAGKPLREKITAGIVTAAILACCITIAVRPMLLDMDAEVRTTNLDVCFAVDTTISMWAEDFSRSGKRIDGVKADISRIMEALPGSSFSLIRFDNGAQILSPYTQNITALADCIDSMTIPSYATAEGSSLNTAYDALAAMLQAAKEKSGSARRKTIVFLFSDGEITDGSELRSFRELEEGTDDGAVLGYGTKEGGRMNYPGKGYLQNTAEKKDALSVIDEKNLESIAEDLGLIYIHRTEDEASALGQILSRVRRASRDMALRAGDRTGWKETYYYFAGILALLLMGCLFRLFRKGSVL